MSSDRVPAVKWIRDEPPAERRMILFTTMNAYLPAKSYSIKFQNDRYWSISLILRVSYLDGAPGCRRDKVSSDSRRLPLICKYTYGSNGQLVWNAFVLGLCKFVQGAARLFEELHIVSSLLVVLWVLTVGSSLSLVDLQARRSKGTYLPVHVQTVKTVSLDQLCGSAREVGSALGVCRHWSKIGRIAPPANTQEHFKMRMLLLEKVQLPARKAVL